MDPEVPVCRAHKANSLGVVPIEETSEASRRGGRPAWKTPLTIDVVAVHGNLQNKLSKTSARVGVKEEVTPPSRPVKDTHHALRYEDPDGNKMVNEYVRECKIGTGSCGKVVLRRRRKDDKLYAIKIFQKSRLRKLRVAPAEIALMDVLRGIYNEKTRSPEYSEVGRSHRRSGKWLLLLVEVLEYVEGRWISEGSGPPGGIGEETARRYSRDVVAGLSYLHENHIAQGYIKPENLLISSEGRIKIGDFGISRTFEGENDELRRSPGTPVYTAPECCLGVTYRGRAADVWALGCTLYCMVLDVRDEFWYPEGMDLNLLSLLRGLLCKVEQCHDLKVAKSRRAQIFLGLKELLLLQGRSSTSFPTMSESKAGIYRTNFCLSQGHVFEGGYLLHLSK